MHTTPLRTSGRRALPVSRHLSGIAAVWALAWMLAGCTALEEAAPVTPQRPTVSSDTYTTSLETFELEAGVDLDTDGPFAIPTTLKYGAGERTEVSAGWTPWQKVELPGPDEQGIGDLTLGVRHRFDDGDEGSSRKAFQVLAKLPTGDADRGLSSGEIDLRAAGILQWHLEPVSLVGFYELGFLGDPSDSGVDVSHVATVAGSTPLKGDVGVFAELAVQVIPAADIESGLLTTGFTWAVEPAMVLDAGLRAGVGDAVPDLLFYFGMTMNFGKP